MSGVLSVEEANFDEEVLKSSLPVLVDYWAEWCAPCRMIGPIVDDLSKEYEGKAKIFKLDVDKAPGIAVRYAVTSIPTLIIYKDGQPVEKTVGAISKNKIKGMIDSVL